MSKRGMLLTGGILFMLGGALLVVAPEGWRAAGSILAIAGIGVAAWGYLTNRSDSGSSTG